MKDQRKTEIKVGIMTIVGIIILVWILGWAKNFSFTESKKNIKIEFNNVAGLEVGDYVMVNGMRKGFVDDMTVNKNGVLVKVSLDNDVKLNSDASFEISMLDLMGGKKVEINPGNSSSSLNYSKIQQGNFNADIGTVMSMVGSTKEDLVTILSEVKTSVNSLNKYLKDETLHKDITKSLNNLSDVSEKLNILITKNNDNFNKIFQNSAELSNEAIQFIKDNKENFNHTFSEIKNVVSKTDTLLTFINSVSRETKEKKNNLGKMLYDEKFYNKLNEAVTQLNDLTKLLYQQMQNDGIKVDATIGF